MGKLEFSKFTIQIQPAQDFQIFLQYPNDPSAAPNSIKPSTSYQPARQLLGSQTDFSADSAPLCKSNVKIGFAPGWNDDSLQKTLLFNRKPINYSEIFSDARVIFFGDRHDTGATEEKELMDHMAEFKSLGITHLGMEMVPSNMQADLDRWFEKGGKIPTRIQAYIVKRNGDMKIVNGYIGMLQSARRAGIRMIGIEHPEVANGLGQDHSFALKTRNPHWIEQIQKTLSQNPKNKMIVLGGERHFGFSSDCYEVNQILEEKMKVKTIVVSIHADKVYETARQAGISEEKFMVKADRSFVNPGSDYIFHLPGANPYY